MFSIQVDNATKSSVYSASQQEEQQQTNDGKQGGEPVSGVELFSSPDEQSSCTGK